MFGDFVYSAMLNSDLDPKMEAHSMLRLIVGSLYIWCLGCGKGFNSPWDAYTRLTRASKFETGLQLTTLLTVVPNYRHEESIYRLVAHRGTACV